MAVFAGVADGRVPASAGALASRQLVKQVGVAPAEKPAAAAISQMGVDGGNDGGRESSFDIVSKALEHLHTTHDRGGVVGQRVTRPLLNGGEHPETSPMELTFQGGEGEPEHIGGFRAFDAFDVTEEQDLAVRFRE